MKVGAISEHSLGGVLNQVDFKEFLRILEIEFGTEYRKLNPPSGGRFATRALPKLDPPQKKTTGSEYCSLIAPIFYIILILLKIMHR